MYWGRLCGGWRVMVRARHVAFGMPDGTDLAHLEYSGQAIGFWLSVLSPEQGEGMLREAGFSNISLFYAGIKVYSSSLNDE